MKNLLQTALALIIFCSCTKVDQQVAAPASGGTQIVPEESSAPIQNLGHVFSGTNIAWKLHPLDFNNTPLFTFLPNQSSGYCLLMIDNGNMDGLTPINAFRFVAVNMQTMSSKIITVKGANGQPANYSLGRIIRTAFGMDKKFYVATEGSPTGGGHLIQYDPFTQTAVDLGKPFKTANSALAIYTLNVGTDGALYGGSFGGEGDVMTFRYDYKRFYVDAAPLDNSSRYVTSVSGDSRYTYAVCGKNNWVLYAIDRQTGEKRVLKSNAGSAVSIDISSNTDAAYAHSVATHYRMTGFSITALPEYQRPSSNRVYYAPYSEADANAPQVFWNDPEKKVMYQLANGQTGAINVDGLQEDIYPSTGPMMFFDNKLYLACYKQGLLGSYAPGEGFKKIGCTNMGIQCMAVPPTNGADANKIFLSGYPKGGLIQYSPNQDWTVNISSFTKAGNGGFATTSTNPRQSALFQKADASGTSGSMSLMGIMYTKSGYIAGAGNNDRITTSSGRELSMGSFKNGTVRNLYLPEFSNYEFQSMCLSKDSNYVFIGGHPHSGNVERLYKYDPAANRVVAYWDIPLWDDLYTNLGVLDNDILVGYCADTIFLFDLKTGQIIWKEVLGKGQRIYAMTQSADGSIYINYMYRSVFNFKIVKYKFDISNHSNIKATETAVGELIDEENNERTKPTGMLVVPGVVPGKDVLYVSGLNSLYRVRI
jgi:hypothetical protein